MIEKVIISTCKSCQKPHYGFTDRNKRCLCDSFGNCYDKLYEVDSRTGYVIEEK